MIEFTDPNWPENNGQIEFPINVMTGWEILVGNKTVVCSITMTIRDEEEMLKLFEQAGDAP